MIIINTRSVMTLFAIQYKNEIESCFRYADLLTNITRGDRMFIFLSAIIALPRRAYVSPVYLLACVIQTLHLLSFWHFQKAYNLLTICRSIGDTYGILAG
jgi:hypothetical protein